MPSLKHSARCKQSIFPGGIAGASSRTMLGSSHSRETVAWMRRSFRSSFADGLPLGAFFNTRSARHQPPGAPICRQAYRAKPSSRPGAATEPTHRQEQAKVVSLSRDSVLARKTTDLEPNPPASVIGHLNAETQSHDNETPSSHLPTNSQLYRARKQYLAKRTERNRHWHGACSEAANATQYAL